MKITPDIQKLAISIDQLRPFPDNPNNGDLPGLIESLKAHEQYKPIVVNRREGGKYGDNAVIAGNHTYMAAMEMGAEEIAVTFVDVDDAEALELNLVDNESARKGRYDYGLLEKHLSSIKESKGSLSGTGFSDEQLQHMMSRNRDGFDSETWDEGLEGGGSGGSASPWNESPEEFREYDEDIETTQECPKCGYSWS